jgi:hypothetical protein
MSSFSRVFELIEKAIKPEPEQELPGPQCPNCKGEGYLRTRGMLDFDEFKCWMCKGTGKEINAAIQAEKLARVLDAATAVATERDRPKTSGERLAYAIKHSTDGVCP